MGPLTAPELQEAVLPDRTTDLNAAWLPLARLLSRRECGLSIAVITTGRTAITPRVPARAYTPYVRTSKTSVRSVITTTKCAPSAKIAGPRAPAEDAKAAACTRRAEVIKAFSITMLLPRALGRKPPSFATDARASPKAVRAEGRKEDAKLATPRVSP